MNDEQSQALATYRLQFNQDFRLTDAQSLVPYFSRLGITHVYASPILRARQASTHGYDVVDPTTINPNLGDKTDLVSLITDLRKLGLGMILDIVPNHMAASIENPYWRDVLTYGHSSPFAGWFDINWRMPDPNMWGRVLVPVLGESLARVLEQNQIRLVWSDGRFVVQYFEHIFPVDPATVPTICAFGMQDLRQSLEEEHPALGKIEGILQRLKQLPSLVSRLRRHVDIDREETEQLLAQFAQLVVQSPRIEKWAEETAERFGQPGEGHQRLRKLLDSQPYRLLHWRDAARAMNYRRFFDINELISIRQEDPRVFDDTHSAVLRWIDDGLLDGLRIDHIDGLRDPLGYLERLSTALAQGERAQRNLPIFVEKILAPDEKLPCGWPVAGTTGYEFLNQLEAVFLAPEGYSEIEEQYRRMLRRPVHFEQVATWGKRRVLRNELSPQVGRLADTLLRLRETSQQTPASEANHHETTVKAVSAEENIPSPAQAQADRSAGAVSATLPAERQNLTKRDLVDAIVEVIVALPIYRTYVESNNGTLSDADRQYVETAMQGAQASGRATPEGLEFLGEVLLLENRSRLPEHEFYERVNFIQRFQQLTGPAAAKGIEDTALYAYVPLVSLNEVGGEPHLPEDPVTALHQANEERAVTWPATMLCVTTHDTKRTADVRARLDVLSELPKLWFGLVRRWRNRNRAHGSRVAGKRAPNAAAEYLFYQTVVSLWPAPDPQQPDVLPSPEALQELRQRIEAYMLKAAREAKTQTAWTNQNREYEDALLAFVRSLLLPDDQGGSPFLGDVQQLVSRIARTGFWNSLSRTLLHYTAPGSPDLYQGDELWNFALVDPDNRRPVDYPLRQQLLDEVINGIESPEAERRAFVRQLVQEPEDGRIKLHLIRSALAARRDHPRLFAGGRYLALDVSGAQRAHVLAFARITDAPPADAAGDAPGNAPAAIIAVPRLTNALVSGPTEAPIGDAVWTDTALPLPEDLQHRQWTCALTREPVQSNADGTLPLAQLFQSFPAALLISRPSS